jgi:hypothetical protein
MIIRKCQDEKLDVSIPLEYYVAVRKYLHQCTECIGSYVEGNINVFV